MLDLNALSDAVTNPDAAARTEALARQAILTKPLGALGRLEELSGWLASVQGVCPPRPLDRVRVVIFAGDHGVARAGVSAYPPEVTAQMVANFVAGGAAINVLARLHDVDVQVADLAVDSDYSDFSVPDTITQWKVRRSSGNIAVEPALTRGEAEAAFRSGMDLADAAVDAGIQLLITGDMGIGNTTPAATLIAVLTDTEIFDVVGRGTGIDDDGWMRKAAAIRDAARRGRPLRDDPLGLLAEVGGADFAAMTGFLVQASRRRTPVLLDGIVSGACALVADRISHRAKEWWLAGHQSTEPAHRAALRHLDLEPLVDYGLRLGEGTGALLALPVLRAAQATLAEMATFESAGVSDRES